MDFMKRIIVDQKILARAESEGGILISDDKDFGELIARLGKPVT